jgi:hypothetical protein
MEYRIRIGGSEPDKEPPETTPVLTVDAPARIKERQEAT